MNKRIIAVCGPTAIGKTKYAIELAKALNGEVVSADSMQLYKFMDIGSAKPTAEEQAEVRHHLVDEIDPRVPFSVADYVVMAKAAINDIFSRGKQPVICGGTGLYINSLIYDMDFSAPPISIEYRKDLERLAEEKGAVFLHDMLKEKDQAAANRIHPNNIKKVIRALEILSQGDDRLREFEESFIPTKDYEYCLIGLNNERDILYSRINKRVDLLVEMGLFEEVQGLIQMGLTYDNISMKGIGYKEIIGYFNGEYDKEAAIELVKKNTRRYAKRQLTWLRRYEDMHWINLNDYDNDDEVMTALMNIALARG